MRSIIRALEATRARIASLNLSTLLRFEETGIKWFFYGSRVAKRGEEGERECGVRSARFRPAMRRDQNYGGRYWTKGRHLVSVRPLRASRYEVSCGGSFYDVPRDVRRGAVWLSFDAASKCDLLTARHRKRTKIRQETNPIYSLLPRPFRATFRSRKVSCRASLVPHGAHYRTSLEFPAARKNTGRSLTSKNAPTAFIIRGNGLQESGSRAPIVLSPRIERGFHSRNRRVHRDNRVYRKSDGRINPVIDSCYANHPGTGIRSATRNMSLNLLFVHSGTMLRDLAQL